MVTRASGDAEQNPAYRPAHHRTTIEQLLFADDPIGINFETKTDEYRPEAESVVLQLSDATSEEDVLHVVHEEFREVVQP